MPQVQANDITLEYDTFGDRGGRPLLLVMGLGAQMILWDEAFCERLADEGHYVVRFDNRDVGLSTKFESAGVPDLAALMAARMAGRTPDAPYTLDHMAADAVGLMDALEIEAAHVCGASMGGMIVQTMAINHGDRLRSMTSIMSTTGNPELSPATPEAMAALMSPQPPELEAFLDRSVEVSKVIGSTGFEIDEQRLRERALRAYERCYHPEGVARQMAAVVAHGNRRPALEQVRVPTLVIHGAVDPLVPPDGGRDTAEAIAGAELLEIPGMGHDLPMGAWDTIVPAISEHTRRHH